MHAMFLRGSFMTSMGELAISTVDLTEGFEYDEGDRYLAITTKLVELFMCVICCLLDSL